MARLAQGTVVIVGTWHHFQEGRALVGRPQDFNAVPVRELDAFLRSVIRTRAIAAVAEEMGDDRLEEIGGTTLVRRIACSLSLPYRNRDLSAGERAQAGLDTYAPEGSAAELRLCEAREAAWRDCLIDFGRGPTLFVCGGKHSYRFAELLSRAGIHARVEVERWEPGHRPESD